MRNTPNRSAHAYDWRAGEKKPAVAKPTVTAPKVPAAAPVVPDETEQASVPEEPETPEPVKQPRKPAVPKKPMKPGMMTLASLAPKKR